MARNRKKSNTGPPATATVFESLLFMGVAATVVAIMFLALALSKYEWALPK